jgi:flagellar motility protein MotE (MotC chaperone)
MVNQKFTKGPIIIMTVTLLVAAAVVVNPVNTGYAQGNLSQALSNVTKSLGNVTKSLGNASQAQDNATQKKGNLTAVIDVDTLSKNIKERHPILAQMAADEDKGTIVVIKGMDPKEAAKTIIALNMLRLLQQYKEVDAK